MDHRITIKMIVKAKQGGSVKQRPQQKVASLQYGASSSGGILPRGDDISRPEVAEQTTGSRDSSLRNLFLPSAKVILGSQ
jgi:hypothetical protein